MKKFAKHRAPPINELGLSVVTGTPGILDPYDVKGFHKLFQNLPNAEKQATIASLNVAALVGGGASNIDLSNGPPQKWWFISEDQAYVLQAQEDFFAFNWRRVNANFGQEVSYPGFRRVVSQFEKNLSKIQKFCDKNRTTLPDPIGCELYYEDIIPMELEDGTKLKLSDSLVEFQRSGEGRPVFGWSNSWFEAINNASDRSSSILKIEINSLGALDKSTLRQIPVLRFTWTAGASRSSWSDVMDFFEVAHDHILKRFRALITEQVQATWK